MSDQIANLQESGDSFKGEGVPSQNVADEQRRVTQMIISKGDTIAVGFAGQNFIPKNNQSSVTFTYDANGQKIAAPNKIPAQTPTSK